MKDSTQFLVSICSPTDDLKCSRKLNKAFVTLGVNPRTKNL